MKKLGKISSLMFTFASLANSSLANTAPTTITPVAKAAQETSTVNVAPLAIGALLICCVLFIGYKMDKAPEKEPKIKPVKVPKMKKEKKKAEQKEAEIFENENKNDIPYEKDENEYYEKDYDFDNAGLNEDSEYEEDDVNIFMPDEEASSSFENTDDDILFDNDTIQSNNDNDFNSTMVFNTDELNNEINNESNNFESEGFFGIRPKFEENVEEEIVEEVFENEDDYEYTDPVEGLDEKIDSLDDLEDYKVEVQEEVQDAESFMNELKKYEQDAAEDDFEGFTTGTAKKVEAEKEKTKKAPKRYTRKKVINELPMVEPEPSEENIEMEMSFLAQMEQNLKKEQETRMKKKTTKTTKTTKATKTSKTAKTTKEKTEKKTTKKTTKKKEE